MSTRDCPSCAVEIDKENRVCPICGYEFPQSSSHMKYVALVLVILFSYPFFRLLWALVKGLF